MKARGPQSLHGKSDGFLQAVQNPKVDAKALADPCMYMARSQSSIWSMLKCCMQYTVLSLHAV